LLLPELESRRIGQGLGLIFNGIQFTHEREHPRGALAVGLFGIEKLTTRVGPAGDFTHVAGVVDSVVASIGIGLQMSLVTRQPIRRPGASSVGRVVINNVGMFAITDVSPDPSLAALAFARCLHRHLGFIGVNHA
jgi:hypothetical protein